MRYILGFLSGLVVGAGAITVYFLVETFNSFDDLDVSPAFSDWAQAMNNRTTTQGVIHND